MSQFHLQLLISWKFGQDLDEGLSTSTGGNEQTPCHTNCMLNVPCLRFALLWLASSLSFVSLSILGTCKHGCIPNAIQLPSTKLRYAMCILELGHVPGPTGLARRHSLHPWTQAQFERFLRQTVATIKMVTSRDLDFQNHKNDTDSEYQMISSKHRASELKASEDPYSETLTWRQELLCSQKSCPTCHHLHLRHRCNALQGNWRQPSYFVANSS